MPLFPAWRYSYSNSLERAFFIACLTNSFFHLWTSPLSDALESQPSFGCSYYLRQTSCRRSGRLKCGVQLSLASTQPGHGSDRVFSFCLKPPANKFFTGSSNTHTIVPAPMPMATGSAIIVDEVQRQKQPSPRRPPKARCLFRLQYWLGIGTFNTSRL